MNETTGCDATRYAAMRLFDWDIRQFEELPEYEKGQLGDYLDHGEVFD